MNDITTYEEFRADYEKRHRAAVPRRATARHEYNGWVLAGVLAMYISSAGLSGVHTAPTVYQAIDPRYVAEEVRQLVSIGSFAAVELAIPLSAFMNRAQRLARWVLATSFIIAVIANITGTFSAQAEKDAGAILVSIALGFGAPLIALMSGEMLVQISASRRATSAEIERDYNDALRGWDAVINTQWTKHQKETPRSLPVRSVHSLNSVNGANEQGGAQPGREYSVNSPNGYSKQMNAREVIREWFVQNPEMMNAKLDVLHERISAETGVKVGRTSIHNVRREIVASSNGHAAPEAPTNEDANS